jgi:drug/metabolite transporter (DMT)-like permease
MFLILLLYALIASTFIFAKNIVVHANPLFILTIRMLFAGSIIILINYFSQKKLLIKKKDIKIFILSGFFLIYLSFLPEFWALQYLSSFTVTLMYGITPFISYCLEVFLYKKKIIKYQVIATIIGFLGLLPMLYSEQNARCDSLCLGYIPHCVLLIAIISGAYGWFIVKNLLKKRYSLFLINGYSMVIGGLMLLITSLFAGFNTVFKMPDLNSIPSLLLYFLLLVIISNGIVYNLYGYLIKKYSLSLVSIIGFTCPLFSGLYELFLYNKTFSCGYWISLTLITIALFIFYKNENN